jgi:ribosomal protein S18 acetylase RimI-like enzyme
MSEAAAAVEIRLATEADVPAMQALGVRTWRATYAGVLSEAQIEAGIAEFWNDYSLGSATGARRMLVATVDGELAGLLESDRLDDGRAVVWKLYVAPEEQGRGIGRALVERHLARAAADGDREVWLEHYEGNDAAAAFYERLGFTARRVEESVQTPGARIVWRARALDAGGRATAST